MAATPEINTRWKAAAVVKEAIVLLLLLVLDGNGAILEIFEAA